MKRQYLVKKILVLSFVFIHFFGNAQLPEDSVVMTIAGKQIPLDEFEFIAKKNNEVDFSSEKSLKEYVELFKNFKLKVAEAESLSLDKTKQFQNELENYKAILNYSYLHDAKAEEDAAKIIYDRAQEYIEISQIVFPIEGQHFSKDTVAAYQSALEVYERIIAGEDFDTVGNDLANDPELSARVVYQHIPYFEVLHMPKVFEEKVYTMSPGEICPPLRSVQGFHLIKVKSRKPHPGLYLIANIRIGFDNDSVIRSREEALAIANEVYQKATTGTDFATLVQEYSSDKIPEDGILPLVKPGHLVKKIEDIVYSLKEPGEITQPILSDQGYHIIKLIEIVPNSPFEREKADIIAAMKKGEYNFEVCHAFDERLKKEYNYQFFPEAYAELEKLAEEYFPSSREFFDKARSMEKTLIIVNDVDFPQVELAYYMNKFPYSVKTYSKDFMKEVFDLFVRDIVTTYEKENMLKKHPEIPFLIKEYRDGMLLFEICSTKIWDKPVEEQAALEAKWIKELNQKYPVKINQKLLKKLKSNARKG